MQESRKRKPLTQLKLSDTLIIPKKSRLEISDSAYNEQRRAGVIKKLVLKNFMCHSHLEVEFKKNISVVIGKNGSGKSAILTALVVGLGGKASITNRGTSIKGFVKAGRNSANIEITLCNEGYLAYKPNIYGESITINRNITASGSSSYKVRSALGEVISSQAKEVHNITCYLNVQIDNPICILNQDTSRNFLSSNDPKHKFTLFMRATKLEDLFNEYKKLNMNKRESVSLLEDKRNQLRNLRSEAKQVKIKIDQHKSIMDLKEKNISLQTEAYWAKVRDIENDVHQEEESLAKLEKKCDSLTTHCSKRSENVNSITENIRKLEAKILEIKDSIAVQTRPQQDLKKSLDELRQRYNNVKREKQMALSTIKSKEQDVEMLQQEITNSKENAAKVEEQKRIRNDRLSKFEEALRGVDDRLQTSRNDLFQIRSDVARREEDKASLKREIADIERNIANLKSSINAIKNESGNSLILYGPKMPQVITMMERNKHRFKHFPRGPLGNYIKLKDKKWAVAIEGFIGGGLLGAFLVDNKQDSNILMEIFSKVLEGRKPTVIISKFFSKKHDVTKNLVHAPASCLSLYEALEIEDPIVANCLVDQSSIETILLIPDTNKAIELLSNRQRVPRNCQQGITLKGDKFYPDPNYKTYASRYHRAQYLQVDTKEHIQQLNQTIKDLESRKNGIMQQYKAICDDIAAQNARKNEVEEKVQNLNADRGKIRRQYEELKASPEPESSNAEVLEAELVELKNTIQSKTARVASLSEEVAEIKRNVTEKEESFKKLQNSTQGLEERIQKLQDEIKELSAKKKELNINEEYEQRRLSELNNKLKEERSRVVMLQNKRHKATEEAEAVGERPSLLRDLGLVMEELDAVKKAILQIQNEKINLVEVTSRYNELVKKIGQTSELIETLTKDVSDLQEACGKRSRYYKLTEEYFLCFIKHAFKKVLEFRQFKGSIKIDMEQKTLEMIVIPQHGSQGQTKTSNLSGGERSFSTVAFLYSLWQCMKFPFYFLDEFDVYMDKMNRSKVFDILIHHAKSQPELQFVFLTPQDVSFLDKDLCILRMQDPERLNVG